MQNIPKFVRIMGMKWEIVVDKNVTHAEQAYGTTHFNTQTIFLDESLSEQKARDTLWHEIMHAIIWHTGFSVRLHNKDYHVDEEEIVVSLSTAQLQVLRDNPELVLFLTANILL